MKLLVCGGRDFKDRHQVWEALDRIKPDAVIHGGASGADSFADEWARFNRVLRAEYTADWNKHGPKAGPIRNQEMIDHGNPSAVLAFPGGRGTADMVARARKANLPILDPTP